MDAYIWPAVVVIGMVLIYRLFMGYIRTIEATERIVSDVARHYHARIEMAVEMLTAQLIEKNKESKCSD